MLGFPYNLSTSWSYYFFSAKMKKLNLIPQQSSNDSHGSHGETPGLDYDAYLQVSFFLSLI